MKEDKTEEKQKTRNQSYAADVGDTGDSAPSPLTGNPDTENGEFEKAYDRSKAQSDEQGRPMTDDDYRSGRGQGTWDEGKFGHLEVAREPWEDESPEKFPEPAVEPNHAETRKGSEAHAQKQVTNDCEPKESKP